MDHLGLAKNPRLGNGLSQTVRNTQTKNHENKENEKNPQLRILFTSIAITETNFAIKQENKAPDGGETKLVETAITAGFIAIVELVFPEISVAIVGCSSANPFDIGASTILSLLHFSSVNTDERRSLLALFLFNFGVLFYFNSGIEIAQKGGRKGGRGERVFRGNKSLS